VNELVRLGGAPRQYVVVGSGKTATDACIWLLDNGVDADAIRWVRPRDPWMLNRAVVQPDPAVFLGMAADTFEAAAAAGSPDEFFLRMEELGVMLRIDRSVSPTMAKAPTLATWELEELRTLEDVVRLGHIRRVEPTRLVLAEGEAEIARGALVVHCAAQGLRYRPLVPIWGPEQVTVQPIRAGFPCFGAALAGYVEATVDDDAEKNRLCPPSPYPDTLVSWTAMQLLGARSAMSFGSDPGIKAWTDGVSLNPSRIPADLAGRADVQAAVRRFRESLAPGLAGMSALTGIA
jgi:hypothetical protein